MRIKIATALALLLTGCSTADINRLAAGDKEYAVGRLVESMTALASGESLIPVAGVALPPQGGTWGLSSQCNNGIHRSKSIFYQFKPGAQPNTFQGRAGSQIESLAGKKDDAKGTISGIIRDDMMIVTSAVVTDTYTGLKTKYNGKKMQVLANGKLRVWATKPTTKHTHAIDCLPGKVKEENGMLVEDLDPLTTTPPGLNW